MGAAQGGRSILVARLKQLKSREAVEGPMWQAHISSRCGGWHTHTSPPDRAPSKLRGIVGEVVRRLPAHLDAVRGAAVREVVAHRVVLHGRIVPDHHLGETGPLSQGVQARRKALRIRYINSMEVRKKRPRGFKKEAQGVQVSPLKPEPPICCSLPRALTGQVRAARVAVFTGVDLAGAAGVQRSVHG